MSSASSLTPSSAIIKEGSLRKKGHVRKNWKTRWFRLTDTSLSYFARQEDAKPIGTLLLTHYTVSKTEKNRLYLKSNPNAPEPKDFVMLGENSADQDMWQKCIADVIEKLKQNSESTASASQKPTDPVAIASGSDGVDASNGTQGEATAATTDPATASLPSAPALGSGSSPPVLTPLSPQSTTQDAGSSTQTMSPVPAPASGSYPAQDPESSSVAQSAEHAHSASEGSSSVHHATTATDATHTPSERGADVAPSSPSAVPASLSSGSGSPLARSPSNSGLKQKYQNPRLSMRAPPIAALEDPAMDASNASHLGSPASGLDSSAAHSPQDGSHPSDPARHPSISGLQQTTNSARRPSLSNLLVPVSKASTVLATIPALNSEDIEAQLSLLADDLKFISNALSWREAPSFEINSPALAPNAPSLTPSESVAAAEPQENSSSSDQTGPIVSSVGSSDHHAAIAVEDKQIQPQESELDTMAHEEGTKLSTQESEASVVPSPGENTENPNGDGETKPEATSSVHTIKTPSEPALTAGVAAASPVEPQSATEHSSEPSSVEQVPVVAEPVVESGSVTASAEVASEPPSVEANLKQSNESQLGDSSASITRSESALDQNHLEPMPTTVVTDETGALTLPQIPTSDPKTHPRDSMRWASSPRSSLTQQLFLALDSSESDREAILDDIIEGIDIATTNALPGFLGGSSVSTSDAETTADLLAALMDPANANYTASPSTGWPSPLELAMQQNHASPFGQSHPIASSSSSSDPYALATHSDSTNGFVEASSMASSSNVSDLHDPSFPPTTNGMPFDANLHTTDDESQKAKGEGEHHTGVEGAKSDGSGLPDMSISPSNPGFLSSATASSPESSPNSALKSSSGPGSGWSNRPSRKPTHLQLRDSAASHRTASATEIHQLEKAEMEARVKRLKERLISPEDPNEIYDCTERSIGKGGMGEVFFATRKSSGSNRKIAIKKLHTFFKGKDRLPTILNEINVMAHSKHPNIINYIGAYQVDQELWVCMEYMDKGSLYDLVRLNIKLDEKHMAYIIKQIVYALTFIHDLKRVHRDIKVDNVLMSSRGEIKLADFGAAVQLTFQRLKRTTMTGTPYYMSPEVIGGKQYDELVDVWSLGILCIELAERAPPYYDLPPDQALDKIVKDGVKGLQGRRYSSDFIDFVNNKCLQFEPSKRWTAAQLQTHPFLKKAVTQQEFASHLQSLDSMSQVDSGCTIL
jgi:hypothetical protein